MRVVNGYSPLSQESKLSKAAKKQVRTNPYLLF